MISIVKKKNKISRELLSKIEWACKFSSIELEQQMVIEGCLRIIEHTNLAYVEPHRVVIKNITLLVFNYSNDVYISKDVKDTTRTVRSVNDLNMAIKDFEHSAFEIEKENHSLKYEIELKDNEIGNLKNYVSYDRLEVN